MFLNVYLFQNEKFSSVKDRIQKRLDVPDKEFEKVRNEIGKKHFVIIEYAFLQGSKVHNDCL